MENRRLILAVLLVAAAIPYFVNLGVSSIWDANEAFYAQAPREMMAAGDYVNPTFNFQLRYNKPVLSYWEVIASYRLFGVSERSERLPIALGGLALIATAFGLANIAGGVEAGLLAALVLATSPRLLLLARRIIIDVHIATFTGLILLCFALAEAHPARRRRYLILMYIAAGLGVLVKGPVAVFLPAVVFFLYLLSQRRLGDLTTMMLPLGAVISLAIAAPWYFFVWREHGWTYIHAFLFGENLDRFAEPVGEQARGIFFYVPVMLADLFPWSLLIPVALWWGIREWGDRRVRLLLIWVAVIVIFFSLSGTKEDLYILPIVPAEAALVAVMLAKAGARASVRWAAAAAGLLLIAAGGGMFWTFSVAHRYTLNGAGFVGAAGVAGGVAALLLSVKSDAVRPALAIAAAFVVISWCAALCVLPDFERYKPVRPFSRVIAARATPAGIVASYNFALPSMVFYLNRPVMEIRVADQLRAAFYSRDDVHVIMPESDYKALKETLPVPTFVLGRQSMFDLRPQNFLNGSELPGFVLISNRSPLPAAAQ